eukprot:TRINITY_DN1026_c0_g7_i1.p1 TRINITY_DN1026_c0_g7~~TRINITY_DN1026_c0_g7_i1.p1  ORF type:complete len:213 (+),score=24.95 TRINITY_DN1026_c0_g7_i1:53-691(+)
MFGYVFMGSRVPDRAPRCAPCRTLRVTCLLLSLISMYKNVQLHHGNEVFQCSPKLRNHGRLKHSPRLEAVQLCCSNNQFPSAPFNGLPRFTKRERVFCGAAGGASSGSLILTAAKLLQMLPTDWLFIFKSTVLAAVIGGCCSRLQKSRKSAYFAGFEGTFKVIGAIVAYQAVQQQIFEQRDPLHRLSSCATAVAHWIHLQWQNFELWLGSQL